MGERLIDAGAGLLLAASDEGKGIPVVLLHGLTATRRYVVMGSSALQRGGHRVVAYDARAHGASSPAPAPDAYGYPQLCTDLRAVLDTLGIERAVLAGVSMGAHSCLRLALELPERVAALVAITPGFDPAEFDDPQRLARWDALSDALRRGGIDGFVEEYGLQRIPARWRDSVARALRQRMAAHEHPAALADAIRAVPRSAPFSDLHALERIECPAVVVGSRDEADPGHRLEVAERYAQLLPRGRLVVEDEGRSPLAWQGGRVSRLIADVAAQAG
ncbi:MAG TPA: alpha/beta hydrolase [Solirubrobacteraceae bacterium]|nr:alpha/beta hydrolase [Solirubrobacteraceae bacterium]